MFDKMRTGAMLMGALLAMNLGGCAADGGDGGSVIFPTPIPTATEDDGVDPTPTHTEARGTRTPTLVPVGPTRTRTMTPGPTRTPHTCNTGGPKPFTGVAATCYNDQQRGGSVIPDSQLDECAGAYASMAQYGFTYGKYGYDNFNRKLKVAGMDVICGAFTNNTPNDGTEIQNVSADIKAGNCKVAAIVDGVGAFDAARFGTLLDQFTVNDVNPSFPKTILASHSVWTDPANESFLRARTSNVLATWYPLNDPSIITTDQAIERFTSVCQQIRLKYSGRDTYLITGTQTDGSPNPLANDVSAAIYARGATAAGEEQGCKVIIFNAADEAWQSTEANPSSGEYGVLTWTLDGHLVVKPGYENYVCIPSLP